MKFRYIFSVVLGIVIVSCGGVDSDWKSTNLIEHGLPITIMAPDSLEVQRSSIAFQEDITIEGPNDFGLQVFVSDAYVNNLSEAIKSQKESVQGNAFFHAMISEDDQGFVFENRIDSANQIFGFRHVRLMGGKEYVFQEPLMSTYTEEQAKRLFEAVKKQD